MKKIIAFIALGCIVSSCASKEDPFTEGYDLGSSDTAKKHYWMLQNLQSQKSEFRQQNTGNYKAKYYAVPGTAVTREEGVNYEPHDILIKTYE